MTSDAAPAVDQDRPTRSAALALARLHLRTGALALARTELETLAGRDQLDDPGILDLAEVRWRTGDVAGAGEAVAALLDGVDDAAELDATAGSPLAWIIAAEAAAARGRPTEARRYADRLRTATSASIDAIFAGLPRSSAWPPDPLTMVPTSATLFPTSGDRRSPGHGAAGPDAGTRPRDSGRADEARPAAAGIAAVGAPGLWDEVADGTVDDHDDDDVLPEIDPELAAVAEAIAATEALADLQTAPEESAMAPPDPLDADDGVGDETIKDDADASDALAAGTLAIQRGDATTAAMHLGLVLRLAPALAPAVLAALGDRDARELAFVRGDAYRLLGREREARAAYRQARPPLPTPSDEPRIDDPAG